MATLAEMRKRRYLSQQELADLAKIAKATIAKIESGVRVPRGRTVRTLAGALGVQPDDIDWPSDNHKAADDADLRQG